MAFRIFGILATMVLMVGCSGGSSAPPTGQVTGKITFRGKPVTVGTITFSPVSGGPNAYGTIQPDGSYELSTDTSIGGDGAIVGKHKIAIRAQKATKPGTMAAPLLLPRGFENPDKSGLTAEVKAGKNVLDIECERTPYQVVAK